MGTKRAFFDITGENFPAHFYLDLKVEGVSRNGIASSFLETYLKTDGFMDNQRRQAVEFTAPQVSSFCQKTRLRKARVTLSSLSFKLNKDFL